MMRRHSISVTLGGILIVLLLAGAGSGPWAADPKPVSPPAPAVGAGGTGAAKPLPATISAGAPVSRLRADKSDPFKPFMETNLALKKKQEEELKKKAVKRSGPISPLQQAEIGHFRLVGIAGNQNRRTAMVEDGVAKRYYPLFIGTYIGLNEGRVTAILPDRVIVEERDDKQAGKAKTRRVTVMLHKEDEGKP